MVIDHAFEVKSVGTVVLGIVKQGKICAHDSLVLYPSGKEVMVKSIQMQDDDVQSAASHSRVGLALKGVTAGEIKRGDVLSAEGKVHALKDFEMNFRGCKFYKKPLDFEKGYHFMAGLQFVFGVGRLSGASLKLSLNREVAYTGNESIIVCDINASYPRIVGVATQQTASM